MNDFCEILGRIVAEFRIEQRQDRVGRVQAEQNGVTIRRRFCDCVGRDSAAAAGAVLDHHSLLGIVGEMLRDDARDLVGDTARRGRHQNLDRLRGKSCACAVRSERRGQSTPSAAHKSFYQVRDIVSSPVSSFR